MSAGIIMKKKIGDRVSKGDVIATLHAASDDMIGSAISHLENGAYRLSDEKPDLPKLIYEVIR